MHMTKKTILWTISLIILGIATAYGTLYYLQWRDKKLWEKQEQEQQQIQEEQKELTDEQFLNSLANPEYKDKEITSEDIKSLESLKSEIKLLSEEEKAKELEFLESLKAPIK